MRRFMFVLCALMVIYSTSKAETRKMYFTYDLNEVECNDESTNGTIDNQLVSGLSVNHYKDTLIDLSLEFEMTHIKFQLNNNAKKTMKIQWDDMVLFIGGASHPVFHSGVILKERCDHKQPTNVMKGMPITDVIIPCDMVNWSDALGRFLYNPLIWGESYDNSIVKLLFPIEINNQKYEYVFTFSAHCHKQKVKINFVGDGMVEFIEVK